MPEISGPFIAAAIATVVSFIVSLASYAMLRRMLAAHEAKSDRQLERSLVLKLYDRRLTHYGAAFDLTEAITLKSSGVFLGSQADLQTCRTELAQWKSGEVSLIISAHALKAYNDLQDALGKAPGGVGGNGELFTREQAERVVFARNAFRRALREDVMSLNTGDLRDRGLWEEAD